jgi:UDP-N-acetylmuramoylalanine--D-glutamate ligase
MAERRLDGGRPTFPFTCGKGAAVIPRLYAIGTTLFVHETERGYASSTEIACLDGIATLRGRHNVQNALAALAALRALQDRLEAAGSTLTVWQPDRLRAALATYPGLAHRLEQVGERRDATGRILFINDSKATNADSTEKALAAWNGGIYWILGGKPKDGGITSLRPYFPRIAKAYLIGAASEEFAATLGSAVPFERCGTLDAAVAAAARDAAASRAPVERVVLLSPASASYDQFKNFEVRGDAFRALVEGLAGRAGDGA